VQSQVAVRLPSEIIPIGVFLTPHLMPDKPLPFPIVTSLIADPAALQAAALTNLDARTTYRGEVLFPCVPAALGHYLQQLDALFKTFGRSFAEEEWEAVQQLVAQTLNQGFESNPNAMMLLQYTVTATANLQKELACNVAIVIPSLAEQYQQWQGGDRPFGSHPDAKLMALLPELGEPAIAPILDIGAGTGRNALPLARLGYPVDALELTPEFATQLQIAAQTEGLSVTILTADLLDPLTQLKPHHYQLVLLSEVVPHFRTTEQLRHMLVKACDALRPGGLLLFNSFLAIADYTPDPLAQEIAQVAWSSFFTRSQLAIALEQLPLELVSDESTLTYEAAHLPAEAFPPTPWFVDWAQGKSAFPLSDSQLPIELRWLLYRRGSAL